MRHIPILDGIRAYAVLMVCVAHFFQVDEASLYETNRYLGVLFFKLSQLGLTGVELFFLLSGFLITNILLDSKNSINYFPTFFARRILRIFPLYYFVLAISFFILPLLYVPDAAGLGVIEHQVWLWTYTSNISFFFDTPPLTWDGSVNFPHFGHFWSLGVEEHFYIFWPLIVYFVKEKWLPAVMWGLILFSLVVVVASWYPLETIKLLRWGTASLLRYVIPWCANLLVLAPSGSISSLVAVSRKIILPSTVFFIVQTFIPRFYEFKPIFRYLSSLILFSSAIVIALSGSKVTTKMFSHRILFRIGQVSYGVYIYHFMLRPFFKSWLYDNIFSHINNGILAATLYTVFCILLTVLIAKVSWIVLEEPALRLKRYFPTTKSDQTVPQPP